MYSISCDGYTLYDPRDSELIVKNPKCKLEVNTTGEASFSIYASHPYYDKMHKLRSVFEIKQGNQVIFRGRQTEDTRDFYNSKDVDLEGAMAYFNDSIIRPFSFPEDFLGKQGYITASESGNVIEYFLSWLIDQHNSQVQTFQQFKLGDVTVTDPNNYLFRSNTDYASTWDTLKSKLFDSSLGGYLCIRYESDGNYIDYLSDFTLTNTQSIRFDENMLDISDNVDASETYSAIIPLGKKPETANAKRLTISSIADGDITTDIVKSGDTLYSKSAVEQYGWIYAPTSDTTWDDVTEASNLLTKGKEWIITQGTMFADTMTIKAVDLHFSDEEIAAFRIYRYINVESLPHNHSGSYKLTKLDIDILNPQNTIITIGDTKITLTDTNSKRYDTMEERIETTENQLKENVYQIDVDLEGLSQRITDQSTSLINTCNEIILSALSSYVETSDYETYKETIESQFKLLSDEMTLKFSETFQQIANVNGDLQEKYNTITKYFTFDVNGLTIGQVDSPYKVVIDNDRYSMLVNGIEVLWLANGIVHTPEIEVTRALKLFGYLIDQDSAGNVNLEYVGGE